MGYQLDRLRYGFQPTPDPFRAREEVETQLLENAALLRCIDAFAAREVIRESSGVPPRAEFSTHKTLEKLQTASGRGQGEIALGILRAYHERCTTVGSNQERGIFEVYQYLKRIAPASVSDPNKDGDLGKKDRAFACEAYADSLLALQHHVKIWNRKPV